MFTVKNGFERWVACYHAGDNMFRRTNSNTWHDDGEASLSVPDDGVSVLAVIAPGTNGETAWFITPIKTAEQLKNARRMLKRLQIETEINGAEGSEARSIVNAERVAQAKREASRRATIAYNKAQIAVIRAQVAATWCNPMHGAFDVK